MAQLKPEWEIVKEAETLVERLCELYPEKLGHIDPGTIGCAMITNKDRPDSADWDFKLIGVRDPVSLYSSKQYVIWFHKNVWDVYEKKQKAMMIMRALLKIPEDLDGSVVAEDLKDIKCLVRTWGVDYMTNPNLPDLSDVKQVF
jgi:hypothetical protein